MAASSEEMASRAAQYDVMAVKHATVTYDERKGFATASVRYLNNFVKSCMIDCACRTMGRDLKIADVAGGRGQDQSKWMYGCQSAGTSVIEYYGLDLSEKDCTLGERMASKYLVRAQIRIETGDMGRMAWNPVSVPMDIVTCQLALHYMCDSETHAKHFFSEAARIIKPDGLLLVSFADGRSVVRRAREHEGVVRKKYYHLDVPKEAYAEQLPSAFGNRYVFTLPDSVEAVPEYLCHEGAILKIAKNAGFVSGISMYFDELGVRLNTMPRCIEIARKMGGNYIEDPDALETANLYRFIVFSKDKATLDLYAKTLVL
jgi:mRNA (guanine-N7-)-methyltransferase